MKRFGNVVNLSHALLCQIVKPGMNVLDATCGNGYDSVLLASLLRGDGLLTVMDIQPEAIRATEERLTEKGLFSHLEVKCIQDSHSNITQYFTEASIDVCIFNLGYLPGGDKTITTQSAVTLEAVSKVLNCLKPGGVLFVLAYPGHPEGLVEKEALSAFFNLLPQKVYDVSFTSFVNQKGQPPVMWLIEKK